MNKALRVYSEYSANKVPSVGAVSFEPLLSPIKNKGTIYLFTLNE